MVIFFNDQGNDLMIAILTSRLVANLRYIKSIDVMDVSHCVICFVVSLIFSSNLYLFIHDRQTVPK